MSAQSDNFALNLLSSLCLNERLSDVHFIFEDVSIPAHRTILAASCPYFEHLLASEEDKNKNEFQLATTPHLFELVLKYIYTGNPSVDTLSDNDVIGLFTLCQVLQLPRLSEMVTNRLNAITISVENVGQMFEAVSGTTSYSALIEKCWNFIDENAVAIVENKTEFAKFSLDLVRAIVGRQTFDAPEIKIFEALFHWKESTQNSEMPEVFNLLRLNLISADEFGNIVRPTQLISDNEYFAAYKAPKVRRGVIQNEENVNI